MPAGVTILDDLEETVLATVVHQRTEEELAELEEDAEAAEGEQPEASGRGRPKPRTATARPSPKGSPRRCACRGGGANAPRRSTCSSSGSATRAASTRGNRHNVGFMVVDELARRHGGSWRSKFSGRLAEVRIDEHRVGLLKPETYMNESGRSVQAAAAFYKLEPDAILVVHDESDLELGRLQARLGGGLAGHNGLRSVAQQLGTPDFLRLRVGVGRPGRGDRRPLADYVLSDFEPHEEPTALVARAADAVETLDAEGLEATQRAFN